MTLTNSRLHALQDMLSMSMSLKCNARSVVNITPGRNKTHQITSKRLNKFPCNTPLNVRGGLQKMKLNETGQEKVEWQCS